MNTVGAKVNSSVSAKAGAQTAQKSHSESQLFQIGRFGAGKRPSCLLGGMRDHHSPFVKLPAESIILPEEQGSWYDYSIAPMRSGHTLLMLSKCYHVVSVLFDMLIASIMHSKQCSVSVHHCPKVCSPLPQNRGGKVNTFKEKN